MLFRAHLFALLVFLMFSPHSDAADAVLPASSVSAASSDKTTYIEAQEVGGKKDALIEADGNVELQQGTKKIFANHVTYEQKTGDLTAKGSVRMEQPTENISGPDLKMNTISHIGEMATPEFELKQSNARGSAALMSTTGPNFYEFDHATYTVCPAGDDDWLLHMSRLDLDRETQIGTAYNAWIEFKSVPILYSPWMDFPLDGARHTGLLGPIYGSTSGGGTELTVPLYLNLAPNYDATIAVRDMTKRGKEIEDEFRFKVAPDSFGEIHYDELAHDHITDTTRYHASLMDTQNLGGGFRAGINLNRVSDNNYFQDLAISMADVTQTQLLNEGVLSYTNGGFSSSVRAQEFQTLQDIYGDIAVPYQRMPQINAAYQKTYDDTAVSLVNEYVDFRHPTLVEGQRMVIYPSVTYSLLNDPGYYLKPKLGLNYTAFEMGNNNITDIPNTTRTLPIFSVDSGMTFERDLNLWGSDYVQTFEPRLFYAKIPYVNQDNLPVYDTSLAIISFPQLFSENRFYGSDRIGDINATTLGITSRLIDGTGGVERIHIGLAQRYYYATPQVTQAIAPTIPPTLPIANFDNSSDIMVSVGGKVTNKITVDSLFDYNPIYHFTQTGAVTLTYKPEIGKILNLGYHFTQDIVTPTNDSRQADFSAQWPLFWHWAGIARVSYDFQNQLLSQQLGGLEYNQSCWTFRVITELFTIAPGVTTHALYVQLELNSLVAVGNNPISELKSSVPGYIQMNDPKVIKTLPGSTLEQSAP